MRLFSILSFLILSHLTQGKCQSDSLLSHPDYYVYHGTMDTLYLTKIDIQTNGHLPSKSSAIFDSIQIDGIGSKEIIFVRAVSGNYKNLTQAHQEEAFTKIHKYEVWNIDTKTLLFEANSHYEFRFENWNSMASDATDDDGRRSGVCSYAYDFSMDSLGSIQISGVKTLGTYKACIPDKAAGLYLFTNGQYIKE